MNRIISATDDDVQEEVGAAASRLAVSVADWASRHGGKTPRDIFAA